jgi:Ni/Co efflux regulator RcnB
MNKYLIVLAGSLALATTAAMAAPLPQPQPAGQYQQDQGQQDNRGQQDRHDDRGRHGGRDKHDNRDRYDNRGWQDNRGRGDNRGYRGYGMHDRGRHEGWYKRGGYMPVEYRSDRYYVSDWRVYHLRQPPRGYRWVRSDNGDFLMVAIATGIIASILAGN